MKVLFVSSYKIRCGIASFTDTLESLLEGDISYDVFALDQFVLRNASPNVSRIGDLAIKKLCEEIIPKYDVVNLQWEPGLLGLTHKQILRRTKMIFAACIQLSKHLVVTAHTVVAVPPKRTLTSRILDVRKNPKDIYRYFTEKFNNYPQKTHELLRWMDRQGKLTLIAHTRRDRRFFRYVVGLRRVVDHPLSYMRKNWLEKLAQENRIKRAEFEAVAGSGKKYIVAYGFLSEYKGLATAIQAMRYLAEDFVLLIYGGVHSGNAKNFQKVNPYLSTLMAEVSGDRTTQERVAKLGRNVSRGDGGGLSPAFQKAVLQLHEMSKPLIDRVFFVEAPDDFDLARVVSAADACVLPHMEIGQSASGVASQAIDLGKRTLLSRTHTFTELAEYFPDRIEFFEIGNALQLAQGVMRLMQRDEHGSHGLQYTNMTQAQFYKEAFLWR